jgi:LytS/YehU family sensor histidine kinase
MAYLENFIELEKLRRNDDIEVHLQADQPYTSHLGIAPFILITFVENAFKHVSADTGNRNWIRISLELHQQQLHVDIANSTKAAAHKDVLHYGGIGLPNVQRRLDLIYPGQYQLDIQHDHHRFAVKLQLQLSALAMAPPAATLA